MFKVNAFVFWAVNFTVLNSWSSLTNFRVRRVMTGVCVHIIWGISWVMYFPWWNWICSALKLILFVWLTLHTCSSQCFVVQQICDLITTVIALSFCSYFRDEHILRAFVSVLSLLSTVSGIVVGGWLRIPLAFCCCFTVHLSFFSKISWLIKVHWFSSSLIR